MPDLKKTMFREYDIRGVVQDGELNEKSAYYIARGFAKMMRDRGVEKCVVGYDNRSYAKGIMEEFMRGLVESGIHVKNIGEASTPMTYWGQYHLDCDGVANGTASHNPNGWFGLKIGYEKSMTNVPFAELHNVIKNEDFVDGEGSREDVDRDAFAQAYIEDLLGRAKLHRPLKIVVNSGNGVAGPVDVEALKRFGCEVIEQNTKPDSTFPNHEPNPGSESFQNAIEPKVRESNVDCGIGFDADGDRLGVVDNLGRTMFADKVLVFMVRLALKKNPGASIVYDVKCSRALEDEIKEHGGVPVMWKTGHAHIKSKAREVGAPVSGERSGHFFYADGYHGYDDGLFAAMKFLEYVSSQEKTVAELHDEVTTYVTSHVYEPHCADEIKYDVVERLTVELKERFGADNVVDINGARVEFEDGWGLVRASSNLPKLVLVFEAKTQERMEEIMKTFEEILANYKEVGPMERD